MSLKNILLWSSLFLYFTVCPSVAMTKKEQISNTGLLFDDETILISKLDGSLTAVVKATGRTKWTLENDPIIQSPVGSSSNSPMPMFFPNPQDGSLYRYVFGTDKEPLKKLPFTIPELVANSPCRSSDGIFYLGKKMDSWIGLDLHTGMKELILGMDGVEKVCRKPSRDTIYIGRTMYNIILFEAHTGHRWNVTFYHYSANPSSTELKDYDLSHFTVTGQGTLVTIDKDSGTRMWTKDFTSPVISLYLLTKDGTLISLPVTAVSPQTVENIEEYVTIHKIPDYSVTANLRPTLFLGESAEGVYAVPAFVDELTATISFNKDHKLLGGPDGQQATIKENPEIEIPITESSDIILFGYYDVPKSENSKLGDLSDDELQNLAEEGVLPSFKNDSKYIDRLKQITISPYILDGFRQLANANMTFITSSDFRLWLANLGKDSLYWTVSDTSHVMFMIILALVICIFVIMYVYGQRYASLHEQVSAQSLSRGSNGSSPSIIPTTLRQHLDNGEIRVGNIFFKPTDILGKGSDGTFVFRGKFDSRDVAVKRVLPGCFSIADREVELLRESDQHMHVIRYFCMEQCTEFRYIALELCAATLEDLISNKIEVKLTPITILYQITSGLHHLHSLGIVHRDIKPSNVLISTPTTKGNARVMISDFGLCRRVEMGKMSFSKRSGVIGTDGWIAPEMMNNYIRPTTKVDIFSLGCVYYYILTKGHHPFGSLLNRQSNILSGYYSLQKMNREATPMHFYIIEKMIKPEAKERPPTSALLKFPIFWRNETTLQFFLDVSDRIEKLPPNDILVRKLETRSGDVVREGWVERLHYCITSDLRKYRDYDNRSVRALLRALRNKKNHYRELSENAQSIFGRIPNEFVPYWTSRFPLLLLHSYAAMQGCKEESVFMNYYSLEFYFKYMNFSEISPEMSPADKLNAELDSALGSLRKGPKTLSKMESKTNPPWKLPNNTFEPHYHQK